MKFSYLEMQIFSKDRSMWRGGGGVQLRLPKKKKPNHSYSMKYTYLQMQIFSKDRRTGRGGRQDNLGAHQNKENFPTKEKKNVANI